jgi:hypothetical protein
MLKLITTDQREVGKSKTSVRTYRNDLTGTEITTYMLRKDAAGNEWWAFEDLFALPFIRQMMAKRIVDLYGHGLSLDDINQHVAQFKKLLKSNDPEKYEKCYAKALEMETLATTMADPVRQCIGLCTVYLMLNDERPDAYSNTEQARKMDLLTLDIDLQTFFLNWWTDCMRHSGKVLKGISAIASMTNQ